MRKELAILVLIPFLLTGCSNFLSNNSSSIEQNNTSDTSSNIDTSNDESISFVTITYRYLNKVIETQTVPTGSKVLPPETPKHSKTVNFIGWFNKDSLFDFDTETVSSNICLDAIFYASVKFFDANNNLLISKTAVVGEPLTLIKYPNDDKFLGWKRKSDNKLYKENESLLILDSEEFYAEVNDLDSILQFDPFYPKLPEYFEFALEVEDIKNRLIVSNDKKTVTLFAPNVSKESGWYDANKNFYNDLKMCWAASCSNMIAWYLNNYKDNNMTSDIKKDLTSIFNNFKNNWAMEGYDFLQGLAWYFTGNTLTGSAPENLIHPESGGYLKGLNNVSDVWSILRPYDKNFSYYGNSELQIPFVRDEISLMVSPKEFSRILVEELHYGPSGLMIVKQGASAISSHAITLWGAEFSLEKQMLTKIYVTDSDDEFRNPGSYLNEVEIIPSNEDHGMKMKNYYLNDGSPFLYITSSTCLLASDVAKLKD